MSAEHPQSPSRRQFLKTGAAAGALSALTSTGSARSFTANETIRIGLVGLGARGSWHIEWVNRVRRKQPAEIVAACDIWKRNRERGVGMITEKYGKAPTVAPDYRKLLDDKSLDAVILATPDHQHCGQLIDAVRAEKDVYVEKPIAYTLEELNEAYDAVTASQQIVQHGTQGRSDRGAASARDFIQGGKLGKLLRVEESRSFYVPYWNGYAVDIKPEDTDWKAFLYNQPDRPFDADVHSAWMGYRPFSNGTIGGWMSHFSDLIHYVTGCGFPKYGVAHGGIFAPTSIPPRDVPDTVTAILEYEEGFTTSYTTHFGNGANDYILWFGQKGTMKTGAPDGWPNGIAPVITGEGSDAPDKIEGEIVLENKARAVHMLDWLQCIVSRKAPNADMEAGYKHGVAVILADLAQRQGCKMMFNAKKREIRKA